MSNEEWIGVDLDGTLAEYHGWDGLSTIGVPIPLMVARVKDWLAEGKQVKIFTARAEVGVQSEIDRDIAVSAVQSWCQRHLGQVLEITATKNLHMIELWDDRCVQLVPNTGLTLFEFNEAAPQTAPADPADASPRSVAPARSAPPER